MSTLFSTELTPPITPRPSHSNAKDDESQEASHRDYSGLLLVASVVMITTGTTNKVIGKLMNKQFLSPGVGIPPRYFEAPWFQTITVYLGELVFLPTYQIYRHFRGGPSNSREGEKPPCPHYWWVVPALLDVLSGALINYAVIFLQVSTVQMLRNVNVVITALLTLSYLRTALRVHQWLGVCVLTTGLAISGLYATLRPDTATNHANVQLLGIFLTVSAASISAFQFVFEENLFRKYYCSPLHAVGMMGFFGTSLSVMPLVLGESLGFERTSETFYMMTQSEAGSKRLLLANICLCCSVSISCIAGLTVTKLGSGLLRTILIATRTFSLWLIELVVGWNHFEALNFIGLLVLLLGVMVYNYNYFIEKKTHRRLDALLRTPVVFCGVRNPDKVEATCGATRSVCELEEVEEEEEELRMEVKVPQLLPAQSEASTASASTVPIVGTL